MLIYHHNKKNNIIKRYKWFKIVDSYNLDSQADLIDTDLFLSEIADKHGANYCKTLMHIYEGAIINEQKDDIRDLFAYYKYLKTIKNAQRGVWLGDIRSTQYLCHYSYFSRKRGRASLWVIFYVLRSFVYLCVYKYSGTKKYNNSGNIIVHSENDKYNDVVTPLLENLSRNHHISLVTVKNNANTSINNLPASFFYKYNPKIIDILKILEKSHDYYLRKEEHELDFGETYVKCIYERYRGAYACMKSNIQSIPISCNPKVLVSTNYIEPVFKLLSENYRSAKTIAIKRGLSSDCIELSMFKGDKILVKSEYEKQLFSKRGINSESIVVTGLPIYDGILTRVKLLNDSKKNDNSKIKILYLTQPISKYFSKTEMRVEICDVLEYCNEFSCDLTIKIHPNDGQTIKILKECRGKIKNRITINTDNLIDGIMECDLVITKFSGAALDAIIANKFVISLFYTHRFNMQKVAFSSWSSVTCVRSKEELLASNPKTIISKRQSSKDTEFYLGPLDFKSITRMSKIITNYAV
jgi:hypothetical protein